MRDKNFFKNITGEIDLNREVNIAGKTKWKFTFLFFVVVVVVVLFYFYFLFLYSFSSKDSREYYKEIINRKL